jgi:hypothetical protein
MMFIPTFTKLSQLVSINIDVYISDRQIETRILILRFRKRNSVHSEPQDIITRFGARR